MVEDDVMPFVRRQFEDANFVKFLLTFFCAVGRKITPQSFSSDNNLIVSRNFWAWLGEVELARGNSVSCSPSP